MSGFFEELQRRKVYRVAAAYIIAAGFIIQIGSAVFPAWELPNWTLRLVVVLLLAGFPVALILAWAYDVTPQGIQATPASPGTHRRRNIIALTAIGLTISAVSGFFLFPRASGRIVEKSIAVLPFQSLSDEKENAYFADGIQDDILTNLSKIGELKVISRMSVMSYRGDGARNAREIGKALGVGTLLEGSVRRIGNRVRVNVQLIDANSDEHIWAEDYDRDLTDVFAIQTDLAQKIAAIDGLAAYCGRYEIDEAQHIMWHYPEIAADPGYVGTKQPRPFRFEGDHLIFSGPQPSGENQKVDRWTIVWQRAK
jgi:TolB-like protein